MTFWNKHIAHEKHIGSAAKTRYIKESNGSKQFLVDRFSRTTSFGCENSWKCQKYLQRSKNAHLMKRLLDCRPNPQTRFERPQALQSPFVSNGPEGRFKKCQSRTNIINALLSSGFRGFVKEDQSVNSRFNNPCPRGDASCSGKLDQRNDQLVPARLPRQQPRTSNFPCSFVKLYFLH